jgi:hypothetical protein
MWPSQKITVYMWFALLNTLGAFIAAVPVCLVLKWLIESDRVRAAFTVGAPTAFLMIASVVAHYAPLSRASVLMAIELFLAVFLALPFWIWVMGALASKSWFERSPE